MIGLACRGPDKGGVGAVGVVAVGIPPGVDEVWVSAGGATDHRRFRLEVALGGGWKIILIGAEERIEKGLSG